MLLSDTKLWRYRALANAVIVVLSMALLIPLEGENSKKLLQSFLHSPLAIVWTGIQLYRSRAVRADADFRKYLAVYLRMAACTVVACTAFGFVHFQDLLSIEFISQHRLSVVTMADVKGDSLVQDLSFPGCESSRRC